MRLFTLFLLLVLSVFSCSDEDPPELTNLLHHDTENFSSPFLDKGTHTLAVKFDAQDLAYFEGKFLEEIHFYVLTVPANAVIELYGEGDFSTPGSLIISENIGSNMQAQSWNALILDTPIEITSEELWIGITVTHNSNINSIGCDRGPRVENGDWFREDGNTSYESFRDFTDGY